ncbi:MAG: DNA helicase [Bowdeniella nasicola]|nr:DNA helicase [Bowdeniella nasicola]
MTPPPIFRRRRRGARAAEPAPVPQESARPARAGRARRRDDERPDRAPEPNPVAVPEETRFLIRRALPAWRSRIDDLAGLSALTDISELGDAIVDLTAAHPSGIAQLYAARPTRLTNLLREGSAYSAGRRATRAVMERADELQSRHGQAPVYLAIGVATWSEMVDMPLSPGAEPAQAAEDSPQPRSTSSHFAPAGSLRADAAGLPRPVAHPDTLEATQPSASSPSGAPTEKRLREFTAPILLRPTRIRMNEQTDGDIELCLEPGVELNPALETSLRHAGAPIDLSDIARATVTSHGFTPRAALSMIVEIAQRALPGFHYDERILLAPFVNPGQLLSADLDALEGSLARRELVAALAGDPASRQRLARPLPPIDRTDRSPDLERGVGDLAPVQQSLVETAASGRSFMVDTAPGANEGEIISAIVADAAASGRSVAVVSGSTRRARTDRAALERLGLEDLVLDLTGPRWRADALERLRSAFVPYDDTLDDAAIIAARRELLQARDVLGSYVEALHQHREPWGVSAHLALQELARLTSDRPPARTRVRLGGEVLSALTRDSLQDLIADLENAADLGAFTLRPHQTAWYGARLTSAHDADRALKCAERLATHLLPELMDRAEAITTDTGLTRMETVEGLREQLSMLQGVREALDVFSPQIFESSAAQMVVATATRAWREEHAVTMKRSTQRRLRKQARDLVRPGRQVEDLHAELVHVQRQAIIWRQHCPAGGWPRLPQGMAATESLLQEVIAELDTLAPVLGEDLTTMPLPDLLTRMHALTSDVDGLGTLPERTEVLTRLHEAGADPLVEDFRARRLPRDHVRAEVELCWWASILETVLRSDRVLATYDGAQLTSLAERFRELDRAQVESLPGPVNRAIGRRLEREVNADKETARDYYRELSSAHPDNIRSLVTRYRALTQVLRPVWIFTPAQISQLLGPDDQLDLVVIDGIQHTPTAHLIGVLARARQVVVFGDPRRRSESAVADLATILPHRELANDRSEREEHVAAFLAAHGYDGLVDAVPAPPSASTMRLELVEGFGMPALGASAVESVQNEVDRVVDLVVEHALTHADRSLAVITLNERHAERIEETLRRLVADSPAIQEFFSPEAAEPFIVTDISGAQGLQRDSVILSVGFGKTPHGRVLHRLGQVSGPDGLSLMVDALDAVRQDLVVVSCFGAGDLQRDRLRSAGAELLYDLLAHIESAQATSAAQAGALDDAAPDRLLVDLADRLWRLGLTVVPRYGVPGGVRIPLAIGHPQAPGELLLAVVTDDEAYVREPSVRVRERHRIERLRDRGWAVYQAFSTSVFMDPQSEAERIVEAVVAILAERAEKSAPTSTGEEAGATQAAGEEEPGKQNEAGAKAPAGEDAASDARERDERPDIVAGLPLSAYSDDQLDDMVTWIASDGLPREDDAFVAELREELQITRRGAQIDAVLRTAVRRRKS